MPWLVALVAFNFVALPIFVALLWGGFTKLALGLLAVALLESVFAALYTVLDFGGAFGPGLVLFCLSPISIALSLIIWILLRRPFDQAVQDTVRRRLYVLGGLALVAFQLAPVAGNYGIGGYCDGQGTRVGNQIVAAMQKYKQDHGRYPEQLAALAPDYLPSIPTFRCLPSVGPVTELGIEQCRDGKALLTFQSYDGANVVRYNFETGNWSGVSFLDGACNFLR